MPIEPVHVIEVGRDGKPRLTRVNPLRRWVQQERLPNGQANPAYHPPIVWQGGRFMDDGGHELPLDAVPQYVRDDVARHVPTHTPEVAPAYLRACPIVVNGVPCDRPVLSTEFEAHLVAHAQGTLVLEDRDGPEAAAAPNGSVSAEGPAPVRRGRPPRARAPRAAVLTAPAEA